MFLCMCFVTNCQGNITKGTVINMKKIYIKIKHHVKYCNRKHVLNREWGEMYFIQGFFFLLFQCGLMQFDIMFCEYGE